jgi:hypothetical protein
MTRASDAVRASLVALTATVALACATVERSFGGGEGGGGGGTTTSSSSTTSSSGSPTTTTTQSAGGGVGDGGSTSVTTTTTGNGGGGGEVGPCGDGIVGAGEECDEESGLCEDCQLECPSGWLESEGSCFGVAIGGGTIVVNALEAQARCGELEVGPTGHRAVAAIPRTADHFLTLARACPNNGCWLGYFNLGSSGAAVFTAPASNESTPAGTPWAENEPSTGLRDVCARIRDVNTSPEPEEVTPAVDAVDCESNTAYFACELRPGLASTATCGDGSIDPGEECDGDDACVGCDRRCPEGWVEDPRTHACMVVLPELLPWTDAQLACASDPNVASRLATPDDPADVRVAQFVYPEGTAWIGAQVGDGNPTWISGEPFDYSAGTWPLPGGLGAAGDVALLDSSGIVLVPGATSEPRAAICEAFDPDR